MKINKLLHVKWLFVIIVFSSIFLLHNLVKSDDLDFGDIHNDPRFQNYVEPRWFPYGYSRILDGEEIYYHILYLENKNYYSCIIETKLVDHIDRPWTPWIGDWKAENYVRQSKAWTLVEDPVLWGGIPTKFSEKSNKVRKWANGKDFLIRVLVIENSEDLIEYINWANNLIKNNE